MNPDFILAGSGSLALGNVLLPIPLETRNEKIKPS